MRIDGNSRTQNLGYPSSPVRVPSAAAFAAESDAHVSGPANAAPMAAMTDISSLLALQGFEDPLFAKRKAMRRGAALLDTLDDIKSDLLCGQVGEGRLNQLLALIAQARERTLPGLDALIDDIELRARVELAKFGHFADA